MNHPIYLEDLLTMLYRLSLFIPPATHSNFIRLSHKDKVPVRQLATQIEQKKLGLTANQIVLVKTLVIKYKRSLQKFNITVDDIELVPLKFPIRVIQLEKSVRFDGKYLIIKYPFMPELIAQFNNFRFTSHGAVDWDPTERTWIIAATEYNTLMIMSKLIGLDGFDIDQEAYDYYTLLVNESLNEYKIEMDVNGIISNAHPLLQSAVAAELAKIDNEHDRLKAMLTLADMYKYTISIELRNMIYAKFSKDPTP